MATLCVVVIGSAAGSIPTEGQSEERLFALSAQLKCQQCVGESVADSQSPSAVQFREEISSQMAQGRTDDEILNFFSSRYDQEVLLTPPSSGVGSLVWVVPVVALSGGLVLLAGAYGRRLGAAPGREMTEDDATRVAEALRDRRSDATP